MSRKRKTLVGFAALLAMLVVFLWLAVREPTTQGAGLVIGDAVARSRERSTPSYAMQKKPVMDATGQIGSAGKEIRIGSQQRAQSSIVPAAGSDCGSGERPKVADGDSGFRDGQFSLDQTDGAGPHYLAARANMDASLRASPDPLDRAVADWLDVGHMRTPIGRVDALAQQAAFTTDARVYALALRACIVGPAAASCAALNPNRWAQLDPANGVPWLYALDQASRAGNGAGQQEALMHMAAASRFDDYRFVQSAAVAARMPADDQGLAAVSDLSVEAIGRAFGDITPLSPLLALCKGDPTALAQCQAISDTMFERTDSVFLRGMAGALQFQTTGDESKRRIARAERALAAKQSASSTAITDCQQERDTLKGILRNGQIGEVAAARERAAISAQ